MAKKTTISGKKGQKDITFNQGGLHRSTHTPEGEKIPQSKINAALRGEYGPRAKKQAQLAKGALAAGRRTQKRKARG